MLGVLAGRQPLSAQTLEQVKEQVGQLPTDRVCRSTLKLPFALEDVRLTSLHLPPTAHTATSARLLQLLHLLRCEPVVLRQGERGWA